MRWRSGAWEVFGPAPESGLGQSKSRPATIPLDEGLTPCRLFRCAARSALLLPEGMARGVDAHHDSARIEELRLGGELAANGARLVQQRVCDEHVRLRSRGRWGHGSLNRRRLARQHA